MNSALELIKRAKSYPSIVGTPPASASSAGSSAYRGVLPFMDIPLLTADIYPLSIEGDFIYIDIITPDGGPINIGPKGRPLIPVHHNHTYIRFKDGFSGLQLQNASGVAANVQFFYGHGEYRVDGSADVVETVPLGGPGTSANMVRPANVTPYTIGDVVGELMTFSSLFRQDDGGNIINGRANIIQARLAKTTATVLDAQFRLWLFNVAPVVAADNAPFALVPPSQTDFQTFIDFPGMVTEGAGSSVACAVVDECKKYILATGGTIYGVLTARGPYVPGNAENIRVTLVTDQF